MYTLSRLIVTLLISGISGWLAGRLMHLDFSVPVSVGVGMVGGFIGSAIFRLIGFYSYGTVANIITSVVGACILLWGLSYIQGRRR